MNYAALTWVTLGAVFIYLATQDENVLPWLVLLSKSFNIWVQRRWFLFRHNPDSPWVRYEINRNARRLADEILKENKSR
jgi:hypothetical protein